MPLEKTYDPHDLGLSLGASRPFDYHAWLDAWMQEYVFFRVDADNRVTFVSPSVQPILGYRPEDVVGRDYREFIDLDHPLHVQLVDLAERLLANDPRGVRRCVAQRGDGQTAYMALRERIIASPAGEAIGREIMAQDVTARVEAELSLRQSERKYRRLVEGAKGDYVIYSRDAHGKFTYVSPASAKVLGYEPTDLVGRPARDLFRHAAEGRRVIAELNRQYRGGKLFQKFFVEIIHGDGLPRRIEVQERAIFGVDGRLAAMEGIAKDVTEAEVAADQRRLLTEELERRVAFRTEEFLRMYEELRESEARYRNVVETQAEFIVRWLPGGTRTFVNDAYCRFRGSTREELLGTSFFPLLHPEDRHVFDRALATITPDQPSVEFELRVFRPDGSIAWSHWVTRAFFDGAGRIVELQSVGRDVTELKLAADLLYQKEAHLAHVSRLATMGEMVAGIAHEVSQPLHAAKTFAEAARRNLAADRPGGVEKAVECMTEISQAVTRTVQIIRRLREFTKSRPVKLEVLDLNSVVREAVELIAYEIRRVHATLRFELADRLQPIEGDRIQLEQVCVNLLKNACEAVERQPELKRRIDVRTYATDGSVGVAIADNGCGIPEEHEDLLFDAFFSTKEQGMGMGLSLCKSMAESHHGKLWFQRRVDQPGVTFQLLLPAKAGSKP
jgi:PAS domain S-box-containing protein